MANKTRYPSRPRHVRIYDKDWDFLESAYGKGSMRPIGTTRIIRGLVHTFVERVKMQADTTSNAELLAATAATNGEGE